MLNIFNRSKSKSPDSYKLESQKPALSIGMMNSIEKIQKDLDLYIQKSKILAETLQEIDNNPELLSQTIENQKITNLIISVLNKILTLRKLVDKQDHKTPELSELFNEYCDQLIDLHFNSKEASIITLWQMESKLALISPQDENYEILKLDLKAKKHYVIGKEYALKLLRAKLECELEKAAKSSFRKLYDNFVSEEVTEQYSPFLQLSLAHLACHDQLSKIQKQKLHLTQLKQKIFLENNIHDKYDLISAYNITLSNLVLTSLKACVGSALINLKIENLDEMQQDNFQKLLEVSHDYFEFNEQITNATIAYDTALRIPSSLMISITFALDDNNEELECQKELDENADLKFFPATNLPRPCMHKLKL